MELECVWRWCCWSCSHVDSGGGSLARPVSLAPGYLFCWLETFTPHTSLPRITLHAVLLIQRARVGVSVSYCRTQPARQPLGLRTLQRVPREHPVPSRLALVRCMRLYSGSCFCRLSLLGRWCRCKNKSRSFIVHTSSLFRRLSMMSVTPWLPTFHSPLRSA